MAHRHVHSRAYTRRRGPLASHADPDSHSASRRSMGYHGCFCFLNRVSDRARRPIHIYGSSTVLVGWAEPSVSGTSLPLHLQKPGSTCEAMMDCATDALK